VLGTLLMSLPRSLGFPAAQVREEPVCLEDIMPTVLELAGCAIPDSVDGRSLVPLLRGDKDVVWRDALHGEHARCYDDVFNNHWLTDGKEKYIWLSHAGREQLFDLQNDPGERRDLAASGEHADRVARWRQRLMQQLEDRPEGFTDGKQLIAGRTHVPVPHMA
jgi:arylsulfatase